MRRRKEKQEDIEEMEEIDEGGGEADEKELKKKKREEKKEKRLKRKKQDKAARWSGTVLLFIIMIVGFLLWVSGQLRSGSTEYVRPVASPGIEYYPSSESGFESPESKVLIR